MKRQASQQKINYTVHGQGRPVILIHGVSASAQIWSILTPQLVQAGWQVIALDLLGHGESYKPNDKKHYQVREIYLALDDWIDSLNLVETPVLIGHSLGGHLCLQYCLDHPGRVEKMVLIDPYYSPSQLFSFTRWMQSRAAIGAAALRRTSGPWFDQLVIRNPIVSKQMAMDHRRQMALDIRRASPLVLHILPTLPDLTPQLANIQTRTLVIWGSQDRTLRASTFQTLVSLLPNSTAHRISGTGHQPHLTTPAIVNAAILNFLASSQT